MSAHSLTRRVSKGIDSVAVVLTWIGNGAIAVITLIFMIDICGRAFLNKPFYGSNELIELTMIILGFAIMYATRTGQHVKMDMLSPRLSRRSQVILTSIGSLLEFGISAVIAYEVLIKALHIVKIHEVSPLLFIPMGPAVFALSISFFVSCLISLLQAVNPQLLEEKSEGGLAI
jgi:TRAP-type C4-dicarboxylate transport system permease small subunit